MVPIYYRSYNESLDGEIGDYYCEVVDGIIVRQINAFGDKLYWADEESEADELYDFTDQPEFDPALESATEISASNFEQLWSTALERHIISQ